MKKAKKKKRATKKRRNVMTWGKGPKHAKRKNAGPFSWRKTVKRVKKIRRRLGISDRSPIQQKREFKRARKHNAGGWHVLTEQVSGMADARGLARELNKLSRQKKSGEKFKAGKSGGRAAVFMKRTAKANPIRKAKTGRWYKGPRGVKIRTRRVKGQFVVDVRP